MRQLFTAACLAAVLAGPALAQDEATTPQTIAIDLFTAANEYARAGDYEAAKRMLEATLDIKPGHPAVLGGLLRVALRSEQYEDALGVLERFADAGLTVAAPDEAGQIRAVDPARYNAAMARIAENGAEIGSANRAAVLDRPGALIEGVAMDIETERLFVSSVAERQILMIDPFDRENAEVFADASDGLWSVFGLTVDDRTRMVWAASGVVPQTPLEDGEAEGTALFAFDLVSGDLYRSYSIEGAGQIADFVVRDGMVYASDSQAPRVYVLNSISSELEVLVEDPRFVNLQGVALARGALYVADYGMGIWRIDLGDRSVSLVRPGEDSLIGIDGLLNTRDGRIVAVRNGAPPHQIMAIDLDREGRAVENVEVLLRAHPDMTDGTEPTLIDLADQRAWLVANAAWPYFPQDGSAPEDEPPATVILEMDLR